MTTFCASTCLHRVYVLSRIKRMRTELVQSPGVVLSAELADRSQTDKGAHAARLETITCFARRASLICHNDFRHSLQSTMSGADSDLGKSPTHLALLNTTKLMFNFRRRQGDSTLRPLLPRRGRLRQAHLNQAVAARRPALPGRSVAEPRTLPVGRQLMLMGRATMTSNLRRRRAK